MRLLFSAVFLSLLFSPAAVFAQLSSPWDELLSTDRPVMRWSFRGEHPLAVHLPAGVMIEPIAAANVKTGLPGTDRRDSRLFAINNPSAGFNGRDSVMKYKDPGGKSVFDFDIGDALTVEAWIKLDKKPTGFIHILSKGRTNNRGFPSGNQNYAFRIDGGKGDPRLSFLFRNREDKVTKGDDFHRWTSNGSFVADGHWHHVAMVYEFGKANSIRGYIDGQPTDGKWDLKGATAKAPIVDNDELWVGSALGVSPSSTFNGRIDEIAVYRKALSAERIALRYPHIPRTSPPPMPETAPPRGEVLVEVIGGFSDKPVWPKLTPQPRGRYTESAFAFFEVPPKYNSKGLRTDRANPLILRAISRMKFEPGEYRLLLRTLRFGRVFVDGKLVLETPQRGHRGSGHNGMYDLDSQLAPGSRQLYPGASERLATVKLNGDHEIRMEIFVGGQGRRNELGETSLSIARGKETFHVLSPSGVSIPLTDVGWTKYERKRRADLVRINAERRRLASRDEDAYWAERHVIAQKTLAVRESIAVPKVDVRAGNDVDRFVLKKLAEEKLEAAPLVDDWQFLRRVSLDTIGTPPLPELVQEFFATPEEMRRAAIIERLLASEGWADHWVGYWQDVLAENPNIIKPTLNNTGPFRFWIFESFLDNNPFDRFVTELIQMEGSQRFGGPAGFEVATQNDVPFAAKAQIVGQAFLGMEMQCARCHDAPYHDFGQKDLFSIAAMLGRKAQGVPKTSTIPGGASNSELVTVSLKPGQIVPASWPFGERLATPLRGEFLRRDKDSRQELAARVTSPENDRFARTIINRVWQRYLGRGIVEPVHDWHDAEPTHPELLAWLGHEFVRSGYDLKHVARLILNSHTYQRVTKSDESAPQLFASHTHRRLSAEQIVDSMFAISGKALRAGEMNIDHDHSNNAKAMINLGIPTRAWMFSSTSNERDRPSLALPFAQPFITTLEMFGWRSSRQNPLTVRDEESNVLQPAILANGVLGRRFTRLSDDSAFTALALEGQPVSELIRKVYERTLTRPPTSEERALFVELLSDGYESRIDKSNFNTPVPLLPGVRRTGVGWSNHLTGASSDVQIATQEIVRQGDPPTKKLRDEWRERFEDMLWTLMNSPEFVFVP
jgi:hypothetical protein